MRTFTPVEICRRHVWFLSRIIAPVLALGFALTETRARAAEVDAAIEKANVYIQLAKWTERAVESWERYLSWVNIKTGPTGKERYIDYGLYDLHDVTGLLDEARRMTQKAPTAKKLDPAITRYLRSYEALAPVINEAVVYYDQKGYARDNVATGKVLHTKLVPLASAFLAERGAMMPELRAFLRDVEGMEVNATEAREGPSAVWHVAEVMHRINRVFDLFPRVRPQPIGGDELEQMMNRLGPDTPGEAFDKIISGVNVPKSPPIDVAAFDDALKVYAGAVARFDGFDGKPPKDEEYFNEFRPMPRQMLDMLTAFREPLAKSKGEEFEGGGQMVSQIYGRYIEMLNASSRVGGSRLEYLP